MLKIMSIPINEVEPCIPCHNTFSGRKYYVISLLWIENNSNVQQRQTIFLPEDRVWEVTDLYPSETKGLTHNANYRKLLRPIQQTKPCVLAWSSDLNIGVKNSPSSCSFDQTRTNVESRWVNLGSVVSDLKMDVESTTVRCLIICYRFFILHLKPQ